MVNLVHIREIMAGPILPDDDAPVQSWRAKALPKGEQFCIKVGGDGIPTVVGCPLIVRISTKSHAKYYESLALDPDMILEIYGVFDGIRMNILYLIVDDVVIICPTTIYEILNDKASAAAGLSVSGWEGGASPLENFDKISSPFMVFPSNEGGSFNGIDLNNFKQNGFITG
jgi:hypothetical protein